MVPVIVMNMSDQDNISNKKTTKNRQSSLTTIIVCSLITPIIVVLYLILGLDSYKKSVLDVANKYFTNEVIDKKS